MAYIHEAEGNKLRPFFASAGLEKFDIFQLDFRSLKPQNTALYFTFKHFLSFYLNGKSGITYDEYGFLVGDHGGLFHYTLGQRKGLGIGGINGGFEKPCFVLKKDITNNVLTITRGRKSRLLFKRTSRVNYLHWITGTPPSVIFYCCAKIRYRQLDQHCKVRFDLYRGHALVVFGTLQRCIAPGQSIVFYDKDVCLGGGVIVD